MQTTVVQDPKYVQPALQTEVVEILAIVDRSGSMGSLVDDAIGGFNTFLKAQQDAPGKATLSLVLFDHEYQTPVTAADIKDVKPLTRETYVPRGSTALLDAIGRGLSGLLARSPERAIVVILTDGQENCSNEFKLDRVKELTQQAKTKGYEVMYLAANQDAFAVGSSMGIYNTLNVHASGAGVRSAYDSATATTLNYRADQATDTDGGLQH